MSGRPASAGDLRAAVPRRRADGRGTDGSGRGLATGRLKASRRSEAGRAGARPSRRAPDALWRPARRLGPADRLDKPNGRVLAKPIRPPRRSAQKDGPMSKPATEALSVVAKRTSKKSAKVAKKAAAKRVVAKAAKPRKTAPKSQSRKVATPALLAGGNPQIAKADGDAPVQAYIAAMPGWKRDVGRRLDALIVRTVPGVRKAVKWNSPLYGVEGQGWFLGIHCFTNYVKVAFFRGTSLRPVPPGESKDKDTRYLDIHEDDQLDEAQLAAWVKQASLLPGERM